MRRIKSYTSIWNVEKVVYAINDFMLPFPITYTQMAWFVMSLLVIIMLGDIPPLSLIDGVLVKYIGLPVGITWFMSQKTFDGKKPFSYMKSLISYVIRPKLTYLGKTVKYREERLDTEITTVRSEIYVSH